MQGTWAAKRGLIGTQEDRIMAYSCTSSEYAAVLELVPTSPADYICANYDVATLGPTGATVSYTFDMVRIRRSGEVAQCCLRSIGGRSLAFVPSIDAHETVHSPPPRGIGMHAYIAYDGAAEREAWVQRGQPRVCDHQIVGLA